MNTDRFFFKINAVFCLYVGLVLLDKGLSQWESRWLGNLTIQDLDKYFDLILRHFAQQSFIFAVLAGYIPALLLIFLVVGFYLYLYERSWSMSFFAFISGTALSALWISRRVFGTAMSVMAAKYVDTTYASARLSLAHQATSFYYYDSLSHVLSSETSLLAYGLFGLLFLRGRGMEFVVGSLFVASSISLLVYRLFTPSLYTLGNAGILLLPAVAFMLSSLLFWQHRPSREQWMEEL